MAEFHCYGVREEYYFARIQQTADIYVPPCSAYAKGLVMEFQRSPIHHHMIAIRTSDYEQLGVEL